MHSAEMGVNGSGLSNPRWRTAWTPFAAPKYFPPAQLRKLRECEQVAAVCYRARREEIEFLLVRTRGGRWIFPKGSTQPGLTHAQSAALEAFEEAGVHGRMEEISFARYLRKKTEGGKSSVRPLLVNTHLCEVSRLEPPQESGRNPTWCSVEQAKQWLREDRSSVYGDQLAQVIECAVKRILFISAGGRFQR